MDETIKTILLILLGLLLLWPLLEILGGLIGLILLVAIPILFLGGILFIPFGVIIFVVKLIKMAIF